MNVEHCVKEEENSLGFYVANSEKQKAQELKQKWCEKKTHGQFVREKPDKVDKDKTWQ